MDISHTIEMLDVDNVSHQKTFDAAITSVWRKWDEEIREQKDVSLHCTEDDKTNTDWMDQKLLTSVVKVRLQPVKSTMKKKAGNKKVTT